MIVPRIFIVDDDHEDHVILREFFSEIGLSGEVMYFTNGELTMNFLESMSDESDLPKLIVLDLNMPVLNGPQTLLQLKRSSRYKNIPVIIFSTSANDEDKRKCLSYGAADYLVKPMTFEEGKRIVEKFASYL